jgi:hypothetical protein
MRRHSSSVDSELSHLINVIFLAVSLLVPIVLSLDSFILRILIRSEEFRFGLVRLCIYNSRRHGRKVLVAHNYSLSRKNLVKMNTVYFKINAGYVDLLLCN